MSAHTAVCEAIEHRPDVVLARVIWNRNQRGHRLAVKESLYESLDLGKSHRLMDECNSGERREVGHTGVAGVQQPEFVELPVVYAVAEQGATSSQGGRPAANSSDCTHAAVDAAGRSC